MENRTTLDDKIYSAIREKAEAWEVAELSDEGVRDKLSKATTEAFDSIIPKARADRFEYYKSHMFEIALEEKAKEAAFLSDMDRGWGKCLASSMVMYNLAYQSAKAYSDYIAEHEEGFPISEKQFTFTSLQHICGRVCQEYLEIYYLLQNGFADGAFARWRSMYELCCCAQFILLFGEKIAEQYCKQSDDPEAKSYAWTKGAVSEKGEPVNADTFARLQNSIEANEIWKDHYKSACLVNHASPQGTFRRLSISPEISQGKLVIHVGQSVYGIVGPAIESSLTLAYVCRMFLTVFPTAEFETRAFVIDDWYYYLEKLYCETDKKLFPSKYNVNETDNE